MAKRKYVPWPDWEEENLLPWVTEHQSLSWDERAAKYRRQYCTNRSSESLRSKCNQLLEGVRRRHHIRSRWSEAFPLPHKQRRTRHFPPAQRSRARLSLLIHIPPPPKLVIPHFRTSALSVRAPTLPRILRQSAPRYGRQTYAGAPKMHRNQIQRFPCRLHFRKCGLLLPRMMVD